MVLEDKYVSVEGQIKKEKGAPHTGIQYQIRQKILSIPEGKSLAMVDLVNWAWTEMHLVPNRRQAYVRINNVMEQLAKDYMRTQDPTTGYTYIVRTKDFESIVQDKQEAEKKE